MADKTLKVPRNLTRAATIESIGEGADRTIRMSISSDEPYERYDYWNDESYFEVLDHGPGGIEDERLKKGLPILFNHDRDRHLGRGQSYECDGHKCTVSVKFGESPFADEKYKDAKAGILVDTSVGYELIGEGICTGAKDGKPVYKFRFKPFEASLVTIPADASVGVGRQRADKPTDEPKEISLKSIDGKPIVSEKHTTNTKEMKLTPAAQRHFLEADKDKGGVAPEVDLTKERGAAVADYRKRCREINDYVDGLKGGPWHEKAREIADKHIDGEASYEAFVKEFLPHAKTKAPIDTPDHGGNQERGLIVVGDRMPSGARGLSIGAQVVRNKDFIERAPQTGRRRSISVQTDMSVMGLRGKINLAQRAGFTSSDLAAVNVNIQQSVVGLGMERLTIMDLIPGGNTGAAAIIYPKENTLGTLDGVAVNSQRPSAGMVGEGGLKPTWDPDVTTDTANVKKIAVVTKLPDEFVADFPAFGSYADNRLPQMVDFKAEEQFLYGDGTGNNIKGITTNAIQTRAYATSWADTIRKAITDVEVGSFFTVDGIVMHPYDWELASLEKDSDGRYIAGGPYYINLTNGLYVEIRTIWGKRVVVTTACAVGKPIVGAWGMGAQYFMREGMRLETTNSNEDDFKRNLIAVRAEERVALATYRASCFLEVTGGPART